MKSSNTYSNTFRRRHYLNALLSVSLLAGISSLFAQGEDLSDDDVYELSPFVIDSSSDTGYVSTQTMAGTRLKTQIKDTPSSLSILTEEFLDELAATDIDSMAAFLPSTESFSMIGLDTSGNGVKAGNLISVRGFKSSTRMRNFFSSVGSTDRYLTERIAASRGPNSLLFGIGNPGGSLLISTKRAHFGKNNGEIELQYDSTREGGYRFTLDQNYVVSDDKLAFRIAVVKEDKDGFREPEEIQFEGAYVTTTWKPFEKTTIRLNYEYEDRHRIIGRPWSPYDYFSAWVDQGAPLYDNLNDPRPGARPSLNNPFVRFENRFVNIVGQDSVDAYRTSIGGGYNGFVRAVGPIINGIEETNISIKTDFRPLDPNQLLRNHFGNDTDSMNEWISALTPEQIAMRESYVANPDYSVDQNTWFAGDRDYFDSTVDIVSLFLEQKVGDNLFIEIAGNFEKRETFDYTTLRNNEYAIQYDPNLYLPDHSVNPYAGMPYVGNLVWPSQTEGTNENYETRATVSYSLDLKEYKFLKWFDLGRHQFSGLANYYRSDAYSERYLPAVYEWGGTPLHQLSGNRMNRGTEAPQNQGRLTGRYYLMPGTDPYISEEWLPLNGEGTVGKSDWLLQNVFSIRQQVSSLAVGTQSFFFDDRFVITGGVRKDSLSSNEARRPRYTANDYDPAIGHHVGVLNKEAALENRIENEELSFDNKSYGAVIHILDQRDGILNNVSAFYNFATNVSASRKRHNIRYEEFNPQEGEGKDWGIKFNMLDNKLIGTFTWYKTTMLNDYRNSNLGIFSRSGMDGFSEVDIFIDPERRLADESVSLAWVPLFDATTEGAELELVWNPVQNFRMRITYSEMESVAQRFGFALRDYLAELEPKAERFINDIRNDSNASVEDMTNADIVDAAMSELRVNVPLKLAFNGVPIPGIPKRKASLTANYRFDSDSRLNGLSVGGNMQWRSASPIAFETDENQKANLGNSFETPEELYIGLNVMYKRKIMNKYDWKIQLNIRNLFNETDQRFNDAVWDRTAEEFIPLRNRMIAPRSFILSNSISW